MKILLNRNMKKLLIIDTFNFLHRAYHALPKTLTDTEGRPNNAVYGVASMLISVFNQIEPNYVVAAMDSEEPTFRVEDFTGYKAHRKPMEDDLAQQIPRVIEILDAFGLKKIMVNGYEADDVIGTVVEDYKDDFEIIVVSNDRDLWQLVDENVKIMVPKRKGQVKWIGPQEVREKMGFEPEKLVDYKALKGDSSDNIPGVYGIGKVTAKKLLDEFKTVENIYNNINKVEPESLKEKLANNAEEAVMSLHLAEIIKDVPFSLDIENCKYTSFNRAAIKDVLTKFNFKSLKKRLGFEEDKEKEKSDSQLSLL